MRAHPVTRLFLFATPWLISGCLSPAETDPAQEDDGIIIDEGDEGIGRAQQAFAYASVIFPVDDVAGNAWYHAGGSPFHRPHGGYSKANDQFCLDLNLAGDADAGKAVKAIANGTVVQKDAGLGWVLVKSACNVTWKGQSYSTCFHGYMHMSGIPAAVSVNASVSKGQQIGNVSGAGGYPNHLHFCHYVASPSRVSDVIAGRNGFLESVDPATTLGSPYQNLNLLGKVDLLYVDDQKSSGSLVFEKLGSGFQQDNSYGFLDGMTFKPSAFSSNDLARYRYDLGIPATGEYGLWAFIPRYHGTATAQYKVYVNDVLKGTYSVNQLSYSDQFVSILGYTSGQCGVSANRGTSMSLSAGSKLRIEVPGATGVSGKEIALDAIQVVRRYADCNNVSK